MARDENMIPLDELFNEKIRSFESGEDREHDPELDKMIWERGDYENEEPVQEKGNFKERKASDSELQEKDLIRSEGGRTYLRESEYLKGRQSVENNHTEAVPLRLEITGVEYEIVCGSVSLARKKKIEDFCRDNDTEISDIWYEDKIMANIMGKTWRGWYKVDEFFHEIGHGINDLDSLSINCYLNDEPLDEFVLHPARFRCDLIVRPKPRKGYVAVTAGAFIETKHIFTIDIFDEFDPEKLDFEYKELKKLGIEKCLLTEVRYNRRIMEYSHEDYNNKNFLDVIFLD